MSVFNGVRVGEFALHSGGTSPVLFDVPAMLWEKADRDYIRDVLLRKWPSGIGFDAIVGVEFGGALLATLIAPSFPEKKLGFYRKSGELVLTYSGMRCVVVDDVKTTGASLAEAKAALDRAGHQVVSEVVLVNRT